MAKFLTRLKKVKKTKILTVLNILNLVKSFVTNTYDYTQYTVFNTSWRLHKPIIFVDLCPEVLILYHIIYITRL